MLTLKASSSEQTPARDAYNGLANSRFHTLLFGINRLRSGELPHCWAKSHCSGAFVQLLCNQKCDGFSDCCGTIATTTTEGVPGGNSWRLAVTLTSSHQSTAIRHET